MPNLVELSIANYRGFYARRSIAFAIPSGSQGSGLTVLVGPNNSGKSTVVSALRLVVGRERPIDMEHRHVDAALEIATKNDSGEEKTITNPDLGAVTVFRGSRAFFPDSSTVRIVPSRRSWSAYSGTHTMGLSDYWNHTLENEQDSVLVGRIAAMLPSQRAEFDRILKELLPEISSWKVELSRGQSFIQYITKAGAQHSADLFGDGMASLFRVSLAIVDSGAGQILVIDEPELSLHPQAQKSLAAMLSRCASDRQILITTHSPYFVSWADLANGAKVYRLAQGEDGVSVGVLDPYTIENLKGLTDDWQKPNLLDAVSREIFFADEVLFLEGQEDMGLLRKFCDDRSLPQMATFGYGAGGFGNIEHFLDMAEDLNIRAAAVYDGDHADAKARAERNFPDALIKILPTPDIRDKLVRDSNNKETDQIQKLGIFDSAGVLKTEYESYLVGLIDEIRGFLKVN